MGDDLRLTLVPSGKKSNKSVTISSILESVETLKPACDSGELDSSDLRFPWPVIRISTVRTVIIFFIVLVYKNPSLLGDVFDEDLLNDVVQYECRSELLIDRCALITFEQL